MFYVKKPIVIEAFKLGTDEPPDWFKYSKKVEIIKGFAMNEPYVRETRIHTPDGVENAYTGDYIIRDVHGELFPCRERLFDEMYDAVAEVVEVE